VQTKIFKISYKIISKLLGNEMLEELMLDALLGYSYDILVDLAIVCPLRRNIKQCMTTLSILKNRYK
jgi:hypothetical protein